MALQQHGIAVCQRRGMRAETDPLVHTPRLCISGREEGGLNTAAESRLGSGGSDRACDAVSPVFREGGNPGQLREAVQRHCTRSDSCGLAIQMGQERQTASPNRFPQILAVGIGDVLGHPMVETLSFHHDKLSQL